MSAVVLILADCPQPPLVQGSADGWPRLPALEYWLARATSMSLDAADWRGWLQQRVFGTGTAERIGDASPAAVVAAAIAARQPTSASPHEPVQHWLATPVHWVAGLDTVRLHPQGLLLLNNAEASELAADFARVFAGSGWALTATGGREFLLTGPVQQHCVTDDPALWCGQCPRDGMVRGAGSKALRQLGAEIEMWLYEHVVNQRRAAAGLPTISALWLWGAGAPLPLPLPFGDVGDPGLLMCDDLYARSLWQLRGGALVSLPPGWNKRLATSAACTVVLSWSGAHPAAVLQALEDGWLYPATTDWRSGLVHTLSLIVGGTEYRLTRAARWRFWSRRKPWWETLLT